MPFSITENGNKVSEESPAYRGQEMEREVIPTPETFFSIEPDF